MRVLLVTDSAEPVGGVERIVFDERAALTARGHEVELLAIASVESGGAPVEWLAGPKSPTRTRRLLTQLHNPGAGRLIDRALGTFEPHLIHFHALNDLSASVLSAARAVPAVLTLHDYALFYPLLHRVLPDEPFCNVGTFPCCFGHAHARYIFELVRTHRHRARLADLQAVIAPSRYVLRVAQAMGVGNAVLCPNGIIVSGEVQEPRQRHPEILYAGRLEHEKGVLALAEAFEIVADSLPSARLVFAGIGTAQGSLAAFAASSRHHSRIELLGRVTHDELARRQASCRILAMPSLWPEPFGLSGLEAMAYGTPVVGSGRGGMSDWLKAGDNGLIADPLDTPAFAAALARLAVDNALFARCSEAARLTAVPYGVDAHVDALLRVYTHALARWQAAVQSRHRAS